jgi:hypothetical protein
MTGGWLKRAAGIQSIAEELDFGNGITAPGYAKAIAELRQKLTHYNELLSLADQAGNAVRVCEREIRDYSERILLGVATRYGKDSDQYEMAGGVRKSERKRPARKATVA